MRALARALWPWLSDALALAGLALCALIGLVLGFALFGGSP